MKIRHIFYQLALISCLFLMACGFTFHPFEKTQPSDRKSNQSQGESGYKVYLPKIERGFGTSLWGITLDSLALGGEMDKMAQAGASWIRKDLVWTQVEPVQGARQWSALSELETGIINARSRGIQSILIFEGTPSWALKPGFECGAVAPEQLQKLGDFAYDAVKRYSGAPYYIEYWELWNEPDVDGFLGCWGDPNDPYYGGAYYAEMLKVVYPRIKAADPKAQVLVGGLLLDCDPRVPVPNFATPDTADFKNCSPARFLEGILENNAGDYFNGVSFHAYDYYSTDGGYYNNPNWNSDQLTSGPVSIAKSEYLKSLLNAKGLYNKYLLNTETALFCTTANCDSAHFTRAKSNYIFQSYTTAVVYNFKSNIWWSAMGYRSSGLLNPDFSPKPAYAAYQFTREKMAGATYVRQLTQPGILGYEFKVNGRTVWALWSRNGTPQNITLTTTPSKIYRMGEDGLPAEQSVSTSIQVGELSFLIEF